MTSTVRARADAKISQSNAATPVIEADRAAVGHAMPARVVQTLSEHDTFAGASIESVGFSREQLLDPQSPAKRLAYEGGKRVFDALFGSLLLLIALPFILTAAAAIRLETPGSPFFMQTRIGKGGRPFRICKLRGMFVDARVRFPTYYDYSGKRDLDFCFHHEDDPRVTRTGMFIRRTSIDELPNLLNVVLGDMSLVGPRPEIPEMLNLYGPYRQEYLSVKPGVTCLSKCTGRDRLTKRETIEYDLDYVRKRSFRLDLSILWRTFRSVMLRRDVF